MLSKIYNKFRRRLNLNKTIELTSDGVPKPGWNLATLYYSLATFGACIVVPRLLGKFGLPFKLATLISLVFVSTIASIIVGRSYLWSLKRKCISESALAKQLDMSEDELRSIIQLSDAAPLFTHKGERYYK